MGVSKHVFVFDRSRNVICCQFAVEIIFSRCKQLLPFVQLFFFKAFILLEPVHCRFPLRCRYKISLAHLTRTSKVDMRWVSELRTYAFRCPLYMQEIRCGLSSHVRTCDVSVIRYSATGACRTHTSTRCPHSCSVHGAKKSM